MGQRLFRARVDQGGGQAGEIAQKRGDRGVPGVEAGQEGVADALCPLRRDEHLVGGRVMALHRIAREIGDGADEAQRLRGGQARVADMLRQLQGEATARAVAADGDGRGGLAQRHVARDDVVAGGGKRVLGREAVAG
jgi:hypothetical protein